LRLRRDLIILIISPKGANKQKSDASEYFFWRLRKF
jgi:hypothetical protein